MFHTIIFFITTFIIIYIILFFLTIFILSRIFVPHLNKRIRLPKNIPQSMQTDIHQLKNQASDKVDYLYKTYNYLTNKYQGVKRELWKDIKCVFWQLEHAWVRQGFMTCTMQNYILIIFLIKSGHFNKKDIKKVHAFYGFNVHQYLKVKINNQWIPIDIWSHNYGLRIGDKPKAF